MLQVFRIADAADEVFTSISVYLSTKTKSGQRAAATIAMRQILIARVGKQRLRYAGDYLPIYGAFWGSAFLQATQVMLAVRRLRAQLPQGITSPFTCSLQGAATDLL